MSALIRVTVDEPVTREVTLDQVRAYLRAKGWVISGNDHPLLLPDDPHPFETWIRPDDGRVAAVWLGCSRGGSIEQATKEAVWSIARYEGRSPAAVLREIAGEVEVRRLRDALSGRDSLLDEREASLAAEIRSTERAREEARLWRALADAYRDAIIARGRSDAKAHAQATDRAAAALAALRAAGIDYDAPEARP